VPEQGLLLIPDVGLISGLSNEFIVTFYYALYFTRPAVLNLCQSHLELFLREHASLLSTRLHSKKYSLINIHQMEQCSGCRFLLCYFLGMMTFPVNLYEKLLKRLHCTKDEYEKSMLLYQNRQADFFHNIEHYPHFDIYAGPCLDGLTKKKQILLFTHMGVRVVTMETQDIIDHLHHVIYLLETYHNYQIAFYQPVEEENIYFKNAYCLVKERHSVLFELIHPTDCTVNLHIYSEEPMLTSGFYAYLKTMWERIPPVNKNKYDIIHWLSTVIDVLQGNADENAFLSKL
jgi:hypothetical protein